MIAALLWCSLSQAQAAPTDRPSVPLRVGWEHIRARKKRRDPLDRERYKNQQRWGWTGMGIGAAGFAVLPLGVLAANSFYLEPGMLFMEPRAGLSSGATPLSTAVLALSAGALAIGAPVAIGNGLGSANVLRDSRRRASRAPAITGGVLYGLTPVLFVAGQVADSEPLVWTSVGTAVGSYVCATAQLLHNRSRRRKKRR